MKLRGRYLPLDSPLLLVGRQTRRRTMVGYTHQVAVYPIHQDGSPIAL